MGEIKIENIEIESFFPFLIFILIGLIRLLVSKKKKQEDKKAKPLVRPPAIPPFEKKVASPPPALSKSVKPASIIKETQQKSYHTLAVKRDCHFWKKKKQTRIQKLVAGMGDKRKLFLLSEILRPHDYF